jgi:hypothetical protein
MRYDRGTRTTLTGPLTLGDGGYAGRFGRKGVMSIRTHHRITATAIKTLVVLVGLAGTVHAQPVSATATSAEPIATSGLGEADPAALRPMQAALPESRSPSDVGSATASGIAYPPSPLQTAGALAGALFAILLAVFGVTVTFRSMRNEMRRGRGHSRRPPRSDRTTLHQA